MASLIRVYVDRGEFSTDILYRYEHRGWTDFIVREANGGRRGAHDRVCGDGVWRERDGMPPQVLSEAEAMAWLLEHGCDEGEAAELLESGGDVDGDDDDVDGDDLMLAARKGRCYSSDDANSDDDE